MTLRASLLALLLCSLFVTQAYAQPAPDREPPLDAGPETAPAGEAFVEGQAEPAHALEAREPAEASEPDAAQSEPAEPEPAEPEPEATPPSAPSAPIRAAGQPPSIPRRDVPDYDGRADAEATPEEILLWIPRVIFFPLHLVFEYVLRQPIGWLMTTAEREDWSVVLIDFFTWDERKAGLVPTGFFDFGMHPSAGLYFWWNDLGGEGNDLRAQIGFGGVDWLRATLTDRVRTSRETEISFTADAWRRPDYVYHGLGWDSQKEERSRYMRSYVEGRADFRLRPWRGSEIAFSAGVTWNDFDPNGYTLSGDNPSLASVVQGPDRFYDLPPGFSGYTAYRQRLEVVIDTREDRPAPGHGLRIDGFVEQGFDLTNANDARWLRYGGALGAFVDLSENRVLGLWGMVQLADPLGEAPVPFIEQVQLGGEPLIMSGFVRGHLIGRSAAVATLEYRYPIWVFLDGSLHFSVGNVFGEHFTDFDIERLRMSFGLGLRSIGDRDQSFNILVAFGSTPFVEGGEIDSVRVVIGSRQGF